MLEDLFLAVVPVKLQCARDLHRLGKQGPLARLHQARAQAFGFEAHALDAPALIVAAKEDLSSQAAQTLRHFWRLVARLSGDLALVFLARGGVTYDQAARTERLLTVIKRATHMLNRKGSVQDLWPD
jgi:glucokinase